MKKLQKKSAYRLMRLKDIIAPIGPIPVSRSTWYDWVREGRVSKPIKLGKRISVWPAEEISELISKTACWEDAG